MIGLAAPVWDAVEYVEMTTDEFVYTRELDESAEAIDDVVSVVAELTEVELLIKVPFT